MLGYVFHHCKKKKKKKKKMIETHCCELCKSNLLLFKLLGWFLDACSADFK